MSATRNKFIFLLTVFLMVIARDSFSQATAGKIISYHRVVAGIRGNTTNAIFDVRAYSDNIIRIRISGNPHFSNFSYALEDTSMPSFRGVKISDSGNTILLATNMIVAEIEKSPCFKVTFRDRNGNMINQDATCCGGGTGFNGGKVTVYKQLQQGERFVGMGEALGNLDRKGSGVTLDNTDNYRYGDPRIPMYSSIPFYIGIHHNLLYGLFFNNSFKSFFNFGLSTPYTSVSFDGGNVDYFFMHDTSVAKIIEHYTSLTGRMQLPPKWSLGYQQSRCTYYPQDKVMWIAETFRRKKIPLDGIVLDADYEDGYEPFRTDLHRFPDLPALSAKLSQMDIELTASVYPGVNIDTAYEVYHDGMTKDVFVRTEDGAVFQTEIPPLKVHLPDYTKPTVRHWWIEKMKWMQDNGISGYWNDMNEPAVTGSYLPDNLQFDFDGRKATAAEAKNVYGFQMARSSYEAGLKYRNGQRPFILTRAGFAGVQRYSSIWSGDNTASDEGLLTGILLNNQFGLSGVPFTGYDIGGYIGDGSKNLYARWIEVGVFSPYCRNHREFFGAANEPWAYGEEAEAISKAYIGFRYRLMPYIYSLFYEASQTGMPVERSLCINYPFEEKVYDPKYQYQFLFGPGLLVVPVTSKDNIKKFFLPPGDWYDLYTDEKITGAKEMISEMPVFKLPVFIKSSSILPMQSPVQSTRQKPSDTLYVHVYNGTDKNTFTYYEDDGNTFSYRDGNYCERKMEFDAPRKEIVLEEQKGSYHSAFKYLQFILHGFDPSIKDIRVNDVSFLLTDSNEKVFNPLDELQDLYDKAYYHSMIHSMASPPVKSFTVVNATGRVHISWK